MRNCLILLIIVFMSVFFLSGKIDTSNSTFNKMSSDKAGINRIVEEFWSLSLREDSNALRDITTRIPDDYYNKLNECDLKNGKVQERFNSNEKGLFWTTKGINASQIEFEYNFLFKIASKIKSENYASYKINKISENGNHALVDISYGVDEFRPNRVFILLNKEKGEWKIFMISSGWALQEDNKYFAKTECSDQN